MNDLQVFKNNEFGEIRTINRAGQIFFIGNDVARILGYERTAKAILDHVEQEDKVVVPIQDTIGRMQNTAVINESGLYSLILSSKMPNAKKFKRWVTSEVLPSIRQKGGYIAGQEHLNDSELMAKAVLVAQNTIAEKNRLLQQAYKQIEADSKKVLFANAVTTSKSSILIGELAKILNQMGYDIGQNRLFEWLRDNGYLIRRKGNDYNVPTQKSMDLGLFEIKETIITSNSGTTVRKTSKVTGKGQVYLVNKYAEYANRDT